MKLLVKKVMFLSCVYPGVCTQGYLQVIYFVMLLVRANVAEKSGYMFCFFEI